VYECDKERVRETLLIQSVSVDDRALFLSRFWKLQVFVTALQPGVHYSQAWGLKQRLCVVVGCLLYTSGLMQPREECRAPNSCCTA